MKTKSKVFEYFSIAQELSRENKSPMTLVLVQLLYARFVFGVAGVDFAFYDLINVPRNAWPEYLDKSKSDSLLERLNPTQYVHLVNDKLTFSQIVRRSELRCPEDLCTIGKGIAAETQLSIVDEAQLVSFLSGLSSPESIAVKPVAGSHGESLLVLDRIDQDHWLGLDANTYSNAQIAHHCFTGSSYKQFLIQERIRNHSDLGAMAVSGTLVTFRLLTYLPPGVMEPENVRILFIAAKTPRKGGMADNFRGGDSGILFHNIDLSTGRYGAGFWRDNERLQYSFTGADSHPDSGVKFESVIVPHFDEMKKLAQLGAVKLPELPLLGWDIAVDENGPLVIEANARPDPFMGQICMDSGLREVYGALIGEYASTI